MTWFISNCVLNRKAILFVFCTALSSAETSKQNSPKSQASSPHLSTDQVDALLEVRVIVYATSFGLLSKARTIVLTLKTGF